MYVSELEDRFTVCDLEGNVFYRRASERSNEPGKFHGPAQHLGRLGRQHRARARCSAARDCRSSPEPPEIGGSALAAERRAAKRAGRRSLNRPRALAEGS